MADDKLNTGPKDNATPEAAASPGTSDPPTPGPIKSPGNPPGHEQAVIPGMGEEAPTPAGKVIDLSGIKTAADHSGKEPTAPNVADRPPEVVPDQKRRGRPPKEQAAVSTGKKEKAAEPRTGRPSKVDKAAREEAPPAVRDKVSRGGKDAKGKGKGPGGTPAAKPGKAAKTPKAAPAKEPAPEPPKIDLPPVPPVPPRPVEEGKIVYLKLSELHPFHTFREHPYKVQDDRAMDDLVDTIKVHGVMTPATVRPEKDGKGYEITPTLPDTSPATGSLTRSPPRIARAPAIRSARSAAKSWRRSPSRKSTSRPPRTARVRPLWAAIHRFISPTTTPISAGCSSALTI